MEYSRNDLTQLTELIKTWFHDRNLQEGEPSKQFLKLIEETGELAEGMAKGREDLTKDAVGDIFVVLVGLCLQMDISLEECINLAYDEIKNRKGKLIDGVFVKAEDLK